MALKPLRPCRKPGCTALTRDGWCPEHKPKKVARTESAEWRWMYQTKAWLEELRPGQLLREPFCRECAALGLRVRATVVDHVTPHRGDWTLFADKANLQSLCERHHNRKTAMEMAERKQKQRRK